MIEYIKFWMAKGLAELALPIALVVAILVGAVLWFSFKELGNWISYMRTRNTLPAAGQVWKSDGNWLRVALVDEWRVHLKDGCTSWSIPISGWKSAVRKGQWRLAK